MITNGLCHEYATWFIFWCKSFDLLLNLPISLDILGKNSFVNVVNLWYFSARGAADAVLSGPICNGFSVL